jgi:hypothetical protein
VNFNLQMLKQARDGIQRLINESPEIITIKRQALIDDGFEGQVENPFGTPTEYKIKCRLSHERKFPGNFQTAPVGLSTNLARYILVNYKTVIYEGDVFEAIGKGFRIGVVDILKKFDDTKIIGYQAPLIEAVNMEGES